jgi:serine protease
MPATPTSRAPRWPRRWSRRPAGGWSADLGWGILDAGAALARAAGLDRHAPATRVDSLAERTRRAVITVHWHGHDFAPRGVRASGIARYELWRSLDGGPARRVLSTRDTEGRIALRRSRRYAFYTVAVDHAGNRERAPERADAGIVRV